MSGSDCEVTSLPLPILPLESTPRSSSASAFGLGAGAVAVHVPTESSQCLRRAAGTEATHTLDYTRVHVTPLLKATQFIDRSFSTDPYQFATTKARCTVDAVSLLARIIAKSLHGTSRAYWLLYVSVVRSTPPALAET